MSVKKNFVEIAACKQLFTQGNEVFAYLTLDL